MSKTIIKLDPQVKKKWLVALRSGKYKQTKETLRDKKGYCCLGVLCDLYKRTKINKEVRNFRWDKKIDEESDTYYFTSEDGYIIADASLPQFVSGWAGYIDDDPILPAKPLFKNKKYAAKLKDYEHYEYLSLATLNDRGFTFKQIADIIERFL